MEDADDCDIDHICHSEHTSENDIIYYYVTYYCFAFLNFETGKLYALYFKIIDAILIYMFRNSTNHNNMLVSIFHKPNVTISESLKNYFFYLNIVVMIANCYISSLFNVLNYKITYFSSG